MTVFKNFKEAKAANIHLDFYTRFESDHPTDRILYNSLHDQEAYDHFHLAWYLKQILDIDLMSQSKELTFLDLPRKEKHLMVYTLLSAMEGPVCLLDFGCSLYELIDGLSLYRNVIEARAPFSTRSIIDQIDFHGVDISSEMRLGAKRLHPAHSVTLYEHFDLLDRNFDLIFDYNVSSIAFDDTDSLSRLMNLGGVGFHVLFVSREETFVSMRMGRKLTYFHLEELIGKADKKIYHLFGDRSPGSSTKEYDASLGKNVIEGFFLHADEEFAENWFEISRRHPDVRRWFDEKDIQLRPAEDIW
jgi:hypothetical protein